MSQIHVEVSEMVTAQSPEQLPSIKLLCPKTEFEPLV
jgi:hypothetical protein